MTLRPSSRRATDKDAGISSLTTIPLPPTSAKARSCRRHQVVMDLRAIPELVLLSNDAKRGRGDSSDTWPGGQ